MPYRIYIRTFKGSVLPETKTITSSPVIAEQAFRDLMKRREFWATKTAAVLSLDNKQLEFVRFDLIKPTDPELAKLLAYGKPLPEFPRYLYPEERHLTDDLDERNAPYLLCYRDHRVIGCPFIDDEHLVRLFHDENY